MRTTPQPRAGILWFGIVLAALGGCASVDDSVQTGVHCVEAKNGGPVNPNANASHCRAWSVGPTKRQREAFDRRAQRSGVAEGGAK